MRIDIECPKQYNRTDKNNLYKYAFERIYIKCDKTTPLGVQWSV